MSEHDPFILPEGMKALITCASCGHESLYSGSESCNGCGSYNVTNPYYYDEAGTYCDLDEGYTDENEAAK